MLKSRIYRKSIKKVNIMNIKKAYFAAGCFWGVEYHFEKLEGVITAVSGYMGGHIKDPNYEMVCSGLTGHLEVVEITYDESIVSFETLAKLFFEIHDFTQVDRQGPDIGDQYRTEIFYTKENQKLIALELLDVLKGKGFKPATKLTLAPKYWKAENYHQDYYKKQRGQPYCHIRKKIF